MSMIFKFHRRTSKPAVAAWGYKGGFLVGNINPTATSAGTIATHELIISSAVLGGSTFAKSWGSYGGFFNNSISDGWTNSVAIHASGAGGSHPAVDFCRKLNIGGYSDWYLPAINELEFIYRIFKPSTTNNQARSITNYTSIPNYVATYTTTSPAQTSNTLFRTGGTETLPGSTYWSSTDASSGTAYWLQPSNGGQGAYNKNGNMDVRAVRRSPL